MPLLVTDPELEHELRARIESPDAERWTETWNGVTVVPALTNDEHQELQCYLLLPLLLTVGLTGTGKVRAGVNVSDRHQDWKENYRGPDVCVYLNTTAAVNHGSHWVGGPDFAVEIVSPGEDPRAKLDFYARVATREVLIVDRYPWSMEMYQLQGGTLVLVGTSDLATSAVLASGALPLTFQLRPGAPRPTILVTHTATGQTWTA